MSIVIQLKPEDEQMLLERSRASGLDLPSYISDVLRDHLEDIRHPPGSTARPPDEELSTLDDRLDHDAVASCACEADYSISLEEVRAATSAIPGSMSRAVVEEERAERIELDKGDCTRIPPRLRALLDRSRQQIAEGQGLDHARFWSGLPTPPTPDAP